MDDMLNRCVPATSNSFRCMKQILSSFFVGYTSGSHRMFRGHVYARNILMFVYGMAWNAAHRFTHRCAPNIAYIWSVAVCIRSMLLFIP